MTRPISDTLRDIAGGALVDEASAQMRELVHAVDEYGKGGTITIKVHVKPAGKASGAVNVSYDVTCKKPEGERVSQIMWGTPEGDLLASDPRQQRLDLKFVGGVSANGAELKQVTAA